MKTPRSQNHATVVAAPPPRSFRPPVPAEQGPEPAYHVAVIEVVPIAGTTLACCRDRNDPRWHYEVLTTKPVAVGAMGTVRVVAWVRPANLDRVSRFRPRWALTVEEPAGPPDYRPTLVAQVRQLTFDDTSEGRIQP